MRSLQLSVALGAALCLPVEEGLAQEPARARDTTRLPTLDVTATTTRSTRSPLEQPLAITVIPRSDWFGAKGAGLEDALTFVPGVLAQSRAGWSDLRLVIRGYGARGAGDRSNSGTSRGVRILLDGFPETEPDGRTAFDLIDLAAVSSVEVIRSNASAIWGNAAGGVVSFSTLRRAERPYGWLETTAGGFGFRKLTAHAGYLPGDGELGSSVTWAETDGWREHSAGERFLANLAFTAPLGREARVGIFATGGFNRYDIPGPLTLTQLEADPTQANPTYLSRRERRFNRLGRLGITYETHPAPRHDLRGSLYIQPKFLQRSERGTFRDFTRYHVGGSLLYRYRSAIGAGTSSVLSVGVDEAYQDGAILFYSLAADGECGETLRTDKREGANNLGVFVQEELGFGDRWSLILGARWDDITYYADDYLESHLSGEKSFTRVSPKLGISYRPRATQTLYANLGGGVEAPAGNETDPASTFGQDQVFAINPLLDPIVSTSYEVGMKQVAVVGPATAPVELSYDLAAYHTRVRNEIVPYRGGRFYFTAGRAGRTGVELGGRIRRGGVSALGAFGWNRHRYKEYVVDSVHYGKAGASADYGGNTVVGIPTWTWSTGLQVSPAASPLVASLTLQGTSSYFADDANALTVDGYSTLALMVGLGRRVALGRSGLGVRGSVTVNNLLDAKYVASAFLNPDIVDGAAVAFEPGLPRHLVVSFSLGWLD